MRATDGLLELMMERFAAEKKTEAPAPSRDSKARQNLKRVRASYGKRMIVRRGHRINGKWGMGYALMGGKEAK